MTTPISTSAKTGWVSNRPSRCAGLQLRNGPANSRAAKTGSPRTSGISGAPSRMSGGAIIISTMCCNMCAVSSQELNTSMGEASATQRAKRPARNAHTRHEGIRGNPAQRSRYQPRR